MPVQLIFSTVFTDKTSAEDGTGGKVGIVENLEIHNVSVIYI